MERKLSYRIVPVEVNGVKRREILTNDSAQDGANEWYTKGYMHEPRNIDLIRNLVAMGYRQVF